MLCISAAGYLFRELNMSITIYTNDIDLVSDLKSFNGKGFRVMERIERNDSIDYIAIAENFVTLVIDVVQNSAAGIVTALILERLQKSKDKITEINNVDVTNNHAQVGIIINLHIQNNQSDGKK